MSVEGTNPNLVSTRTARTNTGRSTVRIWEGTFDAIETLVSTLSQYEQWDVDDSESPRYVLTVRTPDTLTGDASIEWSWEIVGEDIQRDMKEHPVMLWLTESEEGKSYLAMLIASLQDPKTAPVTPANSTISTEDLAKFTRWYDIVLKGQTHFLWPHYKLRFTCTVGPTFMGGVNDEGALCVYSSAQIISEHSSFPMYARTEARLQMLQELNPAILFGIQTQSVGYTWGWLQSCTSEAMLPDFKIRMTKEWSLELWETQFATYMIRS